jgi:SAM-dependent methyltransferase
MQQRFYWDDERIAFFRDAALDNAYYRILAERIAPVLLPDDRVLDAGCGLGYLSESLLPFCASVTAADRDARAIEQIKLRVDSDRLIPVEADVFQTDLSQFDAIVCCRFGSTEEALSLFERSHARVLVLIKRNDAAHRIANSDSRHSRTAEEAIRTLTKNGYRFEKTELTLSFDQPLRSEQDAVRFFNLYSDRPAEACTDALARLQRTEDPVFPFRYPIRNSLTVLTVYRK